ncbi:MAG: hypothetical protein JXR96_10485 [Deltaproteobacteria bacterium]|nr:hypothetical protein [Deltaproteobacteria bacterium]
MEPIDRYLARHALDVPEAARLPPPSPELRLCAVIPCLAESAGLAAVLDSLERGALRPEAVEIAVVVNNADGAPGAVREDNQRCLELLAARRGRMRVLALDRSSPGRALPAAEAGVGLARRIGMDLALRRLAEAGAAERGAIACLDGDSPVGPGYADALLRAFERPDAPAGAVCAYRHPIPDSPALAEAAVAYELWMRIFELGLRVAGSPYCFPTIGSCLAASASGYALADGMPPRQAGEDFHFFCKLVKVGRVQRIVKATVFPAARPSDRVPFGTGRAIRRCLEEGPDCYRRVEPPEAFLDLGRFFRALKPGFAEPEALERAARGRLEGFLDAERGWQAIDRIRVNSPDPPRFARAVHHWLDGLRAVRYAHACTRELGRVPALEALARLLPLAEHAPAEIPEPASYPPPLALQRAWLERLRALG